MRQTGCILFIGFLLLLAMNVSAEVNLVGSNNALNYSHWLPKKAYIAFNQHIVLLFRIAIEGLRCVDDYILSIIHLT